ncbi:MAG: universal stress protein [Aestuariibacter sp.]|nr:universal stress protein [Aestuariibacter sp.]
MIKNIVLAIDGSGPARHAQDMAIDIASKYSASLTIVHVLTHDHPSSEFSRMAEVEHMVETRQPEVAGSEGAYKSIGRFLGSGGDEKEARVVVLIGEQLLQQASKSAKQAGLTNVTTTIRNGDYANCILEVAQKVGADTIVMGRRGLSNLKGFVTGSVSHKVSQRAECSVLTVK